jgi:transposase-like protein
MDTKAGRKPTIVKMSDPTDPVTPAASASGRAARTPAKPESPADLQAQLDAVLQELRRVTEQRDILKKALGILPEPKTTSANRLTR